MRVCVETRLFVPANKMFVGGTNKPIFSKTVEVELNPNKLDNLLKGSIKVSSLFGACGIESYNKKSNTFRARGCMQSLEVKHVQDLIEEGWLVNKEGMKHHNMTFDSTTDST